MADLKGLKIRVQQSQLMVDMIKALGAEPVELPYGQVLTGLATKLIDGAENNWPSYVTTDHFRHAGYYTLTEHLMAPEVLVMSVEGLGEPGRAGPQDLPRCRARVEHVHARAMERAWRRSRGNRRKPPGS